MTLAEYNVVENIVKKCLKDFNKTLIVSVYTVKNELVSFNRMNVVNIEEIEDLDHKPVCKIQVADCNLNSIYVYGAKDIWEKKLHFHPPILNEKVS